MRNIVWSAAAVAASLAAAPMAGVAASASYALPEEPAVTLKPGDGVDLAEANCLACHSLDYVVVHPPQMGEAFWQATVKKMVDVMHAPIDPADATAIAAYLAKAY